MATWKKVIVSGSAANVSTLQVDNLTSGQVVIGGGSGNLSTTAINGTGNIVATTGASGLVHSGSFSGSFQGNFVGTSNLPDLTNGTGISAFTYDGSGTATVAVSGASALNTNKITKWTGTAFADSSLTDNGTAITGTTSIQLTGASSQLSGSFSGSFQGNGSGLSGVTATFPTTAKTDLASTDQFYINDGANKYITYGNLLTDLAGTHLSVESSDSLTINTGTLIPAISGSIFGGVSGDITISAAGVATIAANSVALGTDTTGNYVEGIYVPLNSGLSLSNGSGAEGAKATMSLDLSNVTGGVTLDIANDKFAYVDVTDNTTKLKTFSDLSTAQAGSGLTATNGVLSVNSGSFLPYITGSVFSTVSGDITISSAGVAAIGTGVIVNADVAANAAIAYTKINFGGSGIVSGSVLSSPGQGQVVLVTNSVSGSIVDLGLETGDSPTFAGVTAGNIKVGVTDDNTIDTSSGGLTISTATGTVTVDDNLIVTGDLTVNGTTTYLNVQDIYVEDKFIVLASGSVSAGDGGIIIDRGSDTAGNIAFGYDSVTDRWGFQNGLIDTSNALDPSSGGGVSGSFVPYLFTEAYHPAKPVTGEFAVQGSMYITTAGDFWIYA